MTAIIPAQFRVQLTAVVALFCCKFSRNSCGTRNAKVKAPDAWQKKPSGQTKNAASGALKRHITVTTMNISESAHRIAAISHEIFSAVQSEYVSPSHQTIPAVHFSSPLSPSSTPTWYMGCVIPPLVQSMSMTYGAANPIPEQTNKTA